jgi:hypothetical protein
MIAAATDSMQILRLLLNKLVITEYFNRAWEKDSKASITESRVNAINPQRSLS